MKKQKILKTLNYDISVKDLSFFYDNNQIFNKLNLEIKQNSKIAIIGKNGAGKSTFGDLLCGLLSAQSGTILLGNEEIGKNDYSNFSNYIVKLEQTPIIFDDTLRGNLLLAKIDATDEELVSSLELTGMNTWFENLKDGLDTNIYESGDNISGGQKQRIALSRIILLKPKVIILDEFTSSIDEKDTLWFYENITKLFPNSTIIAITHHLNMLNNFEKVYLLENQNLKEYQNA